ncbi:acyl-CoA dehydrogenase [Flavilitoribacter nigricans]|uniref:Acyl-CoA dehydrogenase n=1 Tax=Flavilitoribacter nigricans (strain ATCC 23147 / DSM 23189 / NBRC 102662 / NCIMB 1420 / SS-2) TaxID=1122177 RepID=A0A2D0N0B7_FLAN2|nr:acyl-CoA dehydrogenase [Flavilitoribacter nigricans]PHN01907.1 acyl-CoA dehydrogenase [Flavilitoribacter nigricans DSM 23189 = NBRC 102662]
MEHPLFSRQLLNFLLYDVYRVEELCRHDYYGQHDRDTFEFTIDAATEIADQQLRPFFRDIEQPEPELCDGQVQVPPPVADFVRTFAESGLMASTFPLELDGQQLPKIIYAAVKYISMSANNSFVMYTDLSIGCANLILAYGTTEQQQRFIPNLLNGRWLGTMCLTEPQAGSSLSDIKATARPNPDGTYSLRGQKIFISAGDHDASENIIHLLLARIEGAPEGTKGISLFIVPKYKLSDQETPNDVQSVSIYHKMGQKATPAMHLAFGETGDCTAYLLGAPHKGLPQMFQMMNSSRLGVGLNGISIASAAYQTALQYARERPQGRSLKTGAPVRIIEHPDVRRMLLTQKVIVEGGLAFHLQCYYYLDQLKVSRDPDEKKRYHALLELLTPVAKTYGAEEGNRSVNLGMQVLGGYGYTEDFTLEQMARDVRISSIYEGTTGIQSLALLGREVVRNNGAALAYWKEEVNATRKQASTIPEISGLAGRLQEEMDRFERTTGGLLKLAATGKTEAFLADATLYMEYFGLVNVAWQWLKMAAAALEKPADDWNASMVHAARFFYRYELGRCLHLAQILDNRDPLTMADQQPDPFV